MPDYAEVTAQEAKLVGDEAVNAEVHSVKVHVNEDDVDAQVTQAPDPAPAKVKVYETAVELDEVITDTSDPRAVQIPDAGRGFLDLPIHALAGQTPEEAFASSKGSKSSD